MKSAVSINDRYRIIRPLGNGEFSSVFLVEDSRQKNRRLALKCGMAGDKREKSQAEYLMEEFAVLSHLHHPYIAQVHDFGEVSSGKEDLGIKRDGAWFFTMDFVDGKDLFEVTRNRKQKEIFPLILKLCYAVDFLHRNQLVHGDIKPSNILVHQQQPVLVDFGLSAPVKNSKATGGAGTLEYLSPERIAGGPPSPSSDLYALGLTLYKILAGKLPFSDDKAHTILQAHEDGLQLDEKILEQLPEGLRVFINQSTCKNAWERPASLGGLIECLTLELADHSSPPPVTPPLGQSPFVGRQSLLQAAFTKHPAYPRTLIFHGERGCGKTRLMREISNQAQQEGFSVVNLDIAQSGDSALLESWADSLGCKRERESFHDPALAYASSADRLHKLCTLLCEKIASLRSADSGTSWVTCDVPENISTENLAELHYFLRFLQHSFRRESGLSLYFLAAIPSDVLGKINFNETSGLELLEISAFSEEESLELIQNLLGQRCPPIGLIDYLSAASGGNPLWLRTELDHLIDSHALVWKQGVYQWQQSSPPEPKTPAALNTLLEKKFSDAPIEYQTGLKYAAIFPTSFTPDDLSRLMQDMQENQIGIPAFLHWSIGAQFLTGQANQKSRYSFQHSGLRNLIRQWCDRDFLLRAHRTAAHRLKDTAPGDFDRWSELAYQLKESGSTGEASEAYLTAAELAEKSQNLQACVQCLGTARELAGKDNLPSIDLKLGTRLTLLGRYDEAISTFKRYLENGIGAQEDAEATAFLIQTQTRKGLYADAIESFEKFRKTERLSKTISMDTLAKLNGQAALALTRHGQFDEAEALLKSTLKLISRKDYSNELVLECHQGELALQRGYLKQANQIYRRVLKRLQQSQNRRASFKGKRLCATVLNNLGKIASLQGKHETAISHYEESLSLAREIANPAEECISLIHLGNLQYRSSHFKNAEKAYREALDLSILLQKPREESMSLFNLGNVAFMTGNLYQALESHQRALTIVRALEDPAATANSHAALVIVHLEIGDLQAAHQEIQAGLKAVGSRELVFQSAYLKLLQGILKTQRGEFAEAREEFRVAETQFKSMGLEHEKAQTALEWAELEIQEAKPESLQHAETLVENALRIAHKIKAEELMIQGLCLKAQLDPPQAERSLLQAQKMAEKLDLKNHLWQVHSMRAQLRALGLLPDAKSGKVGADLRIARRILEEIATGLDGDRSKIFWQASKHRIGSLPAAKRPEVPLTLSEMTVRFRNEALTRGLDQLEDLFRIIHLLNRQTDLKTLLECILDTAIKLLRAHRGLVITKKNGSHFDIACARNLDRSQLEEPETAFSYSIAKFTITHNRTILTLDALQDERFCREKSVNHLKLRSVLAVPLRVNGEAIGALYLDNPRRQGAFSDEDVRLMEIVADQASLALENARLRRALEEQIADQSQEIQQARKTLRKRYQFDSLVGGASESMRLVFDQLEKTKDSTLPVLIQGENGTGKKLVAKSLHYNSALNQGPFLSENCSALPPLLLESMLFGHVRGALTDTQEAKKGIFELASGGTVFLDEIQELSQNLQIKLLRFIQEDEIRPLGANFVVKTRTRLITACSQSLIELVESGKFRRDLYDRLCGIDIRLAPVRERREDIPHLVRYFIDGFSGGKAGISKEASQMLYNYSWPGNVRELQNVLQRAATVASPGEITPRHLPAEIQEATKPALPTGFLPFMEAKKKFEKEYLENLLRDHGGNITRAAAATGLYRQYLHRLLRKHNLDN